MSDASNERAGELLAEWLNSPTEARIIAAGVLQTFQVKHSKRYHLEPMLMEAMRLWEEELKRRAERRGEKP